MRFFTNLKVFFGGTKFLFFSYKNSFPFPIVSCSVDNLSENVDVSKSKFEQVAFEFVTLYTKNNKSTIMSLKDIIAINYNKD